MKGEGLVVQGIFVCEGCYFVALNFEASTIFSDREELIMFYLSPHPS